MGVIILLSCLLLAIFSTRKNKLFSVCLLGTTGFEIGLSLTLSENHTTGSLFMDLPSMHFYILGKSRS